MPPGYLEEQEQDADDQVLRIRIPHHPENWNLEGLLLVGIGSIVEGVTGQAQTKPHIT